jgi:enterochelin esterase family protein
MADHLLLARARREGSPLVDGERAVFVWEGDAPPPVILGDFCDWGMGGKPLKATLAAPGVWTYTLPLLPDAYMEYTFSADGTDAGRLPDPLNPRRIWNGINAYNHFFTMPALPPAALTTRRLPGAPRGTLTRHRIDVSPPRLISGRGRTVWLYQPPTDAPCPLLMVLDGGDYLRRGKIIPLLENLMAQKRIRPLALALVENGGAARFYEYLASEATLAFLSGGVLSLAQEHLRLLSHEAQPGAHGILGASMGGLMALYAGLRMPELFGAVISQSGAFALGLPAPPVTTDLVLHLPRRDLRIWQDCRVYEWLLEPNRAMAALLRERGYDAHYREASSGHNYTAWRMLLPDALARLFPAS